MHRRDRKILALKKGGCNRVRGGSTVTLFVSRRNGENLSAAITWEVCHACNRPTNSTFVTLGAGSFPNASFDEIGIWLELLETQTFVDIYNTYKGMYVRI